jgi:hypothetical protein
MNSIIMIIIIIIVIVALEVHVVGRSKTSYASVGCAVVAPRGM